MKKYYVYLFLSIVGGLTAVVLYLIGGFSGEPLSVLYFVQSTWTNSFYAKSLTIDFWTLFFASIIFMIYEGRRIRMPYYGIYPMISLFVAVAFGFPLFLFMRARLIRKLRKSKDMRYYF